MLGAFVRKGLTMKLSDLNEYIQTGAAAVAIVGIFVLGYELRQSNALATQQAQSQSWTNWLNWHQSLNESGVMAVVAKSIEDPASLTLAEKEELFNYYVGWISLYQADFVVFQYTSQSVVDEMLGEAEEVLSQIFSTPYARALFSEVGFGSRHPELDKRIAERISELPADHYTQMHRNIDAKLAKFLRVPEA
ncbi:hypothetical protein NOR51B_199 [Luminiphilus syltensis NOR5-1B]|uniref:Uncharacterized protein n=2 Tax=Luminiphilus TaxID=1341118 RepID=B8KVS7_9GAMM|nr:hypothetical protein NOR51B_199 [Luminiphilus syltensis NOR5-1B]